MQSFRRYPFKRPSKKRRGVKNCKCKVKFKAAQRSTRTVAIFPSSWSEDRFFFFFFHFKSSAPQELLQPSQVRGHVRSAGDRTNQASQKQRCYYQRESLLKVCCKIPTPLRGNILSVSSLEGNTLSVKKI